MSLDSRRCSCLDSSTNIDCEDLLDTISTGGPTGSSSWVIATAVGASVFIILAAAFISLWRRWKAGGSGGAVGGANAGGEGGGGGWGGEGGGGRGGGGKGGEVKGALGESSFARELPAAPSGFAVR